MKSERFSVSRILLVCCETTAPNLSDPRANDGFAPEIIRASMSHGRDFKDPRYFGTRGTKNGRDRRRFADGLFSDLGRPARVTPSNKTCVGRSDSYTCGGRVGYPPSAVRAGGRLRADFRRYVKRMTVESAPGRWLALLPAVRNMFERGKCRDYNAKRLTVCTTPCADRIFAGARAPPSTI